MMIWNRKSEPRNKSENATDIEQCGNWKDKRKKETHKRPTICFDWQTIFFFPCHSIIEFIGSIWFEFVVFHLLNRWFVYFWLLLFDCCLHSNLLIVFFSFAFSSKLLSCAVFINWYGDKMLNVLIFWQWRTKRKSPHITAQSSRNKKVPNSQKCTHNNVIE